MQTALLTEELVENTDCCQESLEATASVLPPALSPFLPLMPHLGQRKDDEGTSTSSLHNDGQEFGVDGTEGAVPRDLGHTDVLVGLVSLCCLPKHMAELALPNHTPAHGWGQRWRILAQKCLWSLVL